MSGSGTTDQETLQNVLKMLDYLFEQLPNDSALAEKCQTREGRASMCEQFGISTTEGPGYAMVNYPSNPDESPLVPWILSTFESALGGRTTPFEGIHAGIGPGRFLYTRLWYALNALLTNADLQKQFLNANKDERVSLLSGLAMQDSYGEQTSLSAYTQDGQNQSLGKSMKTIESTLYNQYEFVC